MKKYILIALILILVCVYAFAQGGGEYNSYVNDAENNLEEYEQLKEFEEFMLQQDLEYTTFLQEQEKAYNEFVAEVERKWNEFIGSTQNQWVDYSENKDVRSIVVFKPDEDSEIQKKEEVKPEEIQEDDIKGSGTAPEKTEDDKPIKPEKKQIDEIPEAENNKTDKVKEEIIEKPVIEKEKPDEEIKTNEEKPAKEENEVIPELDVEAVTAQIPQLAVNTVENSDENQDITLKEKN
ncbi:hypothetical protein GF312_11050, partial [Candidatus Poribacteria bacterium]|nr:hypothetical protein [Candidatus Poribacteria bacterium]